MLLHRQHLGGGGVEDQASNDWTEESPETHSSQTTPQVSPHAQSQSPVLTPNIPVSSSGFSSTASSSTGGGAPK